MSNPPKKPPLLLLKSPHPTPETDTYTPALNPLFTTHYIPVLTHTLHPDALIKLLLKHLDPASPHASTPFPYGALILTSQRAVAVLSAALSSPVIQAKIGAQRLGALELGLWVVGPATAGAVEETVQRRWLRGCRVCGGQEAGRGEVLAGMMLREGGYEVFEEEEGMGEGEAEQGEGEEMGKGTGRRRRKKKPVLFLVGETRRDVIPRMLQSEALAEEERVKVDEVVVYQSAEMEDFGWQFERVCQETQKERAEEDGVRWVVVFSPMAGRGMLKGLGWLDEGTGKVDGRLMVGRRDFVACIGPTTRAYLSREFGFEADVVARKPSPEGVREGIEEFMVRELPQQARSKKQEQLNGAVHDSSKFC